MKHTNNFDFLRFVAALIVIVGHSYSAIGRHQPVIFSVRLATYGVMIFFAISGYLIAGSWINQPSFLPYIAKRMLRIFPALVVLILLTTFVAGPILTTLPLHDYIFNPCTSLYLRNILLFINYRLDGVFANLPLAYSVNGSLWSLPAEFAMYLLAPALLLFPTRKTAVIVTGIAMAVTAVVNVLVASLHADCFS
ncbi:acyltransferase, partial [Paraburkholderia sediminicola]|uniref:acyltransferase family protein n=1 Tax=Paraburkholderia sediminicola TaxID=458836 RepID=UPI0038BCB68D